MSIHQKTSTFPNSIQSSEIESALKAVGISPGHTLCVHSFIGGFGLWESGLETIFQAFINTIGPAGTLLIPTFNYDFCKTGKYDDQNSPSQVGQFSEYCRTRSDAKRSFHPVYSHAVFGADSSRYLDHPSPSAFGKDSIFDRMHEANAMIVGFGVSLTSSTFIHYVEEALQVPYRYLKVFLGKVTVDGQIQEVSIPIYSRYLELNPEPVFDLKPLQNQLLKNGKARLAHLGRGQIVAVHAKDLFQAAVSGYKENPLYFLKSPIDFSQIPTAPASTS